MPIAFGVVLFAQPGAGAITLALLFGLFNLAYGAWAPVQGIELRLRERSPGHVDETSVDQLTEACLRLLGVPGPEAARLVASPLPPVGAVSR